MKISTGILSTAIVSALALARAIAGDFVIDPFDQPGTGQEISIVPIGGLPTGTGIDVYASDVLGGIRSLAIFNNNGLGRSTVSVAAFTGGLFELESTARATSEADTKYGFNSASPGGYAFQEDFSIYNAFRLSAVYSSVPTKFFLLLQSNGGEIYGDVTLPANNGSDLIVPFSSLTNPGGFDITKVHAIALATTTLKPGGAVQIGKFSVTSVPEPSTYGVLAGFGLLSWTAYRRIRR